MAELCPRMRSHTAGAIEEAIDPILIEIRRGQCRAWRLESTAMAWFKVKWCSAATLLLFAPSPASAQNYGLAVSEGRVLTSAAAEQVENSLTANAHDLLARARLIGYYAARAAPDPGTRRARLRHVEWLVRNEPASLLLRNPAARLRPSDFAGSTSDSLEPLRNAWRDQVDRHPNDPIVIENAWESMGAVEAGINGGERAAAYLKRLRVLEPGDPEWAIDLAGLYALDLPRGNAPNAPPDAKRAAQTIAAELQKSTDAAVVGLTGAMVYESARMLPNQAAVAQAGGPLLALSESLLRRASTLNPKNPGWAAALTSRPRANASAFGAMLTDLLHESDLWPGGVVPAMSVPTGGTRMSAAEDAARRPALAVEGLPANLSGDCSVRFDALIGPDGRIKNLQVVAFEHLNIPFVAAERDALRQAQYPPVIVGGKAAEVVTQIDATCPKPGPAVPAGVVGGIAGGLVSAPPAPPPSPPPPPPPPRVPVRVGGNIKPPIQIKNVPPIYPTAARSARVQGVVILDATIGANGHVTGVRVLRSIPLLDAAAMEAVKQWEFTPTLVNGAPVPIVTTVRVTFSLAK